MVVARAMRCCPRARGKRERKVRRRSEERGWEMARLIVESFRIVLRWEAGGGSEET